MKLVLSAVCLPVPGGASCPVDASTVFHGDAENVIRAFHDLRPTRQEHQMGARGLILGLALRSGADYNKTPV